MRGSLNSQFDDYTIDTSSMEDDCLPPQQAHTVRSSGYSQVEACADQRKFATLLSMYIIPNSFQWIGLHCLIFRTA